MAAEKLREAIASDIFEFNDTKIPVTISLGLAQIKIGEESGDEAISRADIALYEAKKTGRNKVCLHQEEEKQAAS